VQCPGFLAGIKKSLLDDQAGFLFPGYVLNSIQKASLNSSSRKLFQFVQYLLKCHFYNTAAALIFTVNIFQLRTELNEICNHKWQ